MSRRSVVVVGLENAGKTLSVRQLRRICTTSLAERTAGPAMSTRTRPTTGSEIDSFSCGGVELKVREVGSAFQLRWAKWYGNADAVLFLVDASDPNAAAAASTALFDLLAETAAGPGPGGGGAPVPVLVLLNKCERCPSRDARARMRALLHLDALQREGRASVLDASAATGEGFSDVVAWVQRACAS